MLMLRICRCCGYLVEDDRYRGTRKSLHHLFGSSSQQSLVTAQLRVALATVRGGWWWLHRNRWVGRVQICLCGSTTCVESARGHCESYGCSNGFQKKRPENTNRRQQTSQVE